MVLSKRSRAHYIHDFYQRHTEHDTLCTITERKLINNEVSKKDIHTRKRFFRRN